MDNFVYSALKPAITGEVDSSENLFSISELLHENTKMHEFSPTELLRYRSREVAALTIGARTVFRDVPQIPLPDVPVLHADLFCALRNRRSCRDFAPSQISFSDVAALLEAANGVTAELPTEMNEPLRLRATPSAGALFSCEVYIAALAVAGLAPGLYHHNPTGKSLALVRSSKLEAELEALCLGLPATRDCGLAILISCNHRRLRAKYGERGYRYGLMDQGHLMQSLWLVATALGLGFFSLGGFHDELGGKLIPAVDGVDIVLGYVALIGTRKEEG